MNFWKNLLKQFDGTLGQTLALIFGIITMLFLIYLVTWFRSGATSDDLYVKDARFHIDTVATDSAQMLVYVDDEREGHLTIHPELAKQPTLDRLIQQLGLIRMRGFHHRNYYELFYRIRYGLSIIQAFASLLAVVLGLLITREGWSTSNRFLLVAFFVFTSFAGLLQLLPESLDIEDNIQTNVKQYKAHNLLQNEVLTYLSTGLTHESREQALDRYIVQLDGRMEQIMDISLNLSDFPAHRIEEKLRDIEGQLDESARPENKRD